MLKMPLFASKIIPKATSIMFDSNFDSLLSSDQKSKIKMSKCLACYLGGAQLNIDILLYMSILLRSLLHI